METPIGIQWRTCYSLADHLGNVRAEFVAHSGGQAELLQQTDYYPFGYTMRQNNYGVHQSNHHLYGGKELQDETVAGRSLEWYDFEARMYDPLIGRFLSTDPLAEKYYGLSPYGYCGNNPVNSYDLHGDSISIVYSNGLEIGETVNYFDGKLYNPDGTAFNGELNDFLSQSLKSLAIIRQSEEGSNMLDELQSSANMFSIQQADKSEFKAKYHNKAYANKILSNPDLAGLFLAEGVDLSGGSEGIVYWNPDGEPLHTTKGVIKNSSTDLAHELFHALDSNRGLLDNKEENMLSRTEWQACYRENILRSQLNYPIRTHYQTKTSTVKIVEGKTNTPIRPFWY